MKNLQLPLIMQDLAKIKGLTTIDLLTEKHKDFIRKVEEKNNLGVLEAINRQHTLLLKHDSSFRKPEAPIVLNHNSQMVFPSVPFSELNKFARNVVSSSPSEKIHNRLVQDLNLKLKPEEATLLIGFDLN